MADRDKRATPVRRVRLAQRALQARKSCLANTVLPLRVETPVLLALLVQTARMAKTARPVLLVRWACPELLGLLAATVPGCPHRR